MKKFISMLLSFCMVISIAFALEITPSALYFAPESRGDGYVRMISGYDRESSWDYWIYSDSSVRMEEEITPENSYAVLTDYYGNETSITTPKTVCDDVPVKYLGYSEHQMSEVVELNISKGVEGIDERAFKERGWKIEKITFPSTLKYIGEYAFYNKYNIKEIQLSEGLLEIGNNAFEKTSITYLTLPKSLTYVGEKAFYNSNLKEIYIKSSNITFDTAAFSLTDLESVKSDKGCNVELLASPENIFPLLYASDIKEDIFIVGNLLCKVREEAGENIVIPEGITAISPSAFEDNAVVKSVTLPDGITSIGERAFFQCISLETINLPNTLIKIDNEAFYYCKNLTSVNLPSSLTSVGDRCFADCFALESIVFPENIENIGSYAFAGSAMTECTILSDNVQIGTAALGYDFVSRQIDEENSGIFTDAYNTIYNVDSTFVIKGNANSTAQQYADNNALNFVSLNGEVFQTTTDLLPMPDGETGVSDETIGGIIGFALILAISSFLVYVYVKKKKAEETEINQMED